MEVDTNIFSSTSIPIDAKNLCPPESEVSNLGVDTEDECFVDGQNEKISSNEIIVEEPKVNMVFNTIEEAFIYYVKYAQDNGFAAARKSSKKVKGEISYASFECNRGGKAKGKTSNPLKPHPQTKIFCPAHINLARNVNGSWRITLAKLEHNHQCSPRKATFFKSNRFLSDHVKRQLLMNDKAGIKLHKTYESLQIQAGGRENLSFNQKDCRNFVDNVRRLQLKEGDAHAMHNYFMKMHKDNSDFFFEMEMNEDNQLKNVFWADARSRAACKEFGDVIAFDTTYLTNRYHMPFAPFVGVNHHGHTILLGCGLISNEDTNSFVWLFRTWKACMGNRDPLAIITDQCMAMKSAIEQVFPTSRHRWCIWHIMKKVPEKFARTQHFDSIASSLQGIVYGSLTIEQFEISWEAFINEYNLQEKEWLNGLYKEKERWVPVFLRDIFWAGMQSTQRSESINSYFDGYIHKHTTLKQFVEQYENALGGKVAKEREEDKNCFQSFIPTVAEHELEKQFQSVYTNAKAKEFQDQFVAKLNCALHIKKESGVNCEYEVVDWITYGEQRKRKRVSFLVHFNKETNDANCICRMFESSGMVCAHQLMVWSHFEVRAPEKYILRRWRKDVQRAHAMVRINYDNPLGKVEAFRQEYFGRICDEVGGMIRSSEEKFAKAVKIIELLKNEFEQSCSIENNSNVVAKSSIPAPNESCSIGESRILDPKIVRSRGRPEFKRKEGIVEKIIRKKKESTKKKIKDVNDNSNNHIFGMEQNIANINFGISSNMEMQYALPNMVRHNMEQFRSMPFSLTESNGRVWEGEPTNISNLSKFRF